MECILDYVMVFVETCDLAAVGALWNTVWYYLFNT